ncbi:MAG: photosystem II biogenesis protein Psp29 [Pseudanabaenales cyanobacterium]|nr:photosystem II biogenesis protein Psp29 [Pseudanabaenales cyanobacterium]
MNYVRTVSDTKRAFYTHHTRPINSVYRRVVEELMVEMHLLSVNVDFTYEPIYALGVVTTFDRFMQGYQPEQDKTSIFNALCQAIESDSQKYRQDVEQLKASVSSLSVEDFKTYLQGFDQPGEDSLKKEFQAIESNPNFKYSRLFAIGLYSLVEIINSELVRDKDKLETLLKQTCDALKLSADKLQKDLDLYLSNLDKMNQAQEVMKDILEAERKKREQRAAQANEEAETASSSEPQDTSSESAKESS